MHNNAMCLVPNDIMIYSPCNAGDDRGPQLVTSFSGVRVIGGQFNQWFNITSIKITQDERDNDYGLHICEVCVARGTPLEMCHNATLNVYVAGAPPVILKAGDEGE